MEVIGNAAPHHNNKPMQYLPLVLLAIFVCLFFSTFSGLYNRWIKWDEGLSHGLLVNSVFVYLLFKSLPWTAKSQSTISFVLQVCALALGSLAWFMFHVANIYIFEQLLLIVLLAGLYGSCYGFATLLRYRLLLLLPIFTIPVWEQLIDSLVNLSGLVVGEMVKIIHIPASIEGNSIFIPYGHIVIADGCSGLRYFEIALALGFIISLLNNYNEKRLVPTLLIAASLGLIANWIRIFALVIIGYQTKMQSSLMANHEYFGWALFGLMCLPAIYFAPAEKTIYAAQDACSQNKPRIVIPLLCLAIGPLLGLLITAEPTALPFANITSAQSHFLTQSTLPSPVTAPEKSFKEQRQLHTETGDIYIEINQYQRLQKTDKLVPFINRLYSNEDWLSDNTKITLGSHTVSLSKLRRKTSGQEVMQLQWYTVGDYQTASLAAAKLLQIPALIRGINNFKIITLQSPCENFSCDQAKDTLLKNYAAAFAAPPNL